MSDGSHSPGKHGGHGAHGGHGGHGSHGGHRQGGAHHHGAHGADLGDGRIFWAVVVNLALTVAQVVGGILAGSLSLVADALHNFSDAASLGIAYAARKIARRPSDKTMTFGYVRAEVVAALINYTTLIVVGLYLGYEAILRFFEPEPVAGWIVVIVAGIALVIDLVTAALTYAMSKDSMNIRAAFAHNLADALGSVGVIIAGTLIILFEWTIVDPIVTLLIAGYVLWLAFSEIGGSIRMLMLGTPPELDLEAVVEALTAEEGVCGVHHVHAFAIDEGRTALEAHVVLAEGAGPRGEAIKTRIKQMLHRRFGIDHCTLELEPEGAPCPDASVQVIGHAVG